MSDHPGASKWSKTDRRQETGNSQKFVQFRFDKLTNIALKSSKVQ